MKSTSVLLSEENVLLIRDFETVFALAQSFVAAHVRPWLEPTFDSKIPPSTLFLACKAVVLETDGTYRVPGVWCSHVCDILSPYHRPMKLSPDDGKCLAPGWDQDPVLTEMMLPEEEEQDEEPTYEFKKLMNDLDAWESGLQKPPQHVDCQSMTLEHADGVVQSADKLNHDLKWKQQLELNEQLVKLIHTLTDEVEKLQGKLFEQEYKYQTSTILLEKKIESLGCYLKYLGKIDPYKSSFEEYTSYQNDATYAKPTDGISWNMLGCPPTPAVTLESLQMSAQDIAAAESIVSAVMNKPFDLKTWDVTKSFLETLKYHHGVFNKLTDGD